MDELILDLALMAIVKSVKNREKKKALKQKMLEIRDAINAAYAGDKDFA